MIKERIEMVSFTNMVGFPTLLPGFLSFSIYNNNIKTALIFIIIGAYPCYQFISKYRLKNSVKGYLSKIIFSAGLFIGCLYLFDASGNDEYKTGIFIYIILPCLFLIGHLITSTASARELRELVKNS